MQLGPVAIQVSRARVDARGVIVDDQSRSVSRRHKMCHLANSINDHHDGVEPLGLWEMGHEVHRNIFPTLSRNGQWS